MARAGAVVLCLVLSAACGCRSTKPAAPQVTINDKSWFVSVAATAREQFEGLSGRSNLRDNEGMLFVYSSPQVLNFCMRSCSHPLDIAFIDADFRIVKIHTMQVEPDRLGRVNYSSEVPARFALEVAGGSLNRAGIKIGDKVFFSGDIPDATKAEDGP